MIRVAVVLATLALFIGCESPSSSTSSKLRFDIAAIDPHGLIGPADGKRTMDYEFCIPKGDSYTRQVMLADPSVRLYPGSSGRIGCGKNQTLCIGNTGDASWRGRLSRLQSLPYIKEIRRTHWE